MLLKISTSFVIWMVTFQNVASKQLDPDEEEVIPFPLAKDLSWRNLLLRNDGKTTDRLSDFGPNAREFVKGKLLDYAVNGSHDFLLNGRYYSLDCNDNIGDTTVSEFATFYSS